MKQIFAAALLLSLAACQQGSDDNIAIDESNTANAAIETLPPDESVADDADSPGNDAGPAALAIPAAFRGRWGMVAADCEPDRSDAKGLITIDSGSIKFYESRGTLTRVTQDAPDSFTGTFAFAGEGMTWTNNQNLKLTGSSNTLVRKQSDEAQPFTYKRCA